MKYEAQKTLNSIYHHIMADDLSEILADLGHNIMPALDGIFLHEADCPLECCTVYLASMCS